MNRSFKKDFVTFCGICFFASNLFISGGFAQTEIKSTRKKISEDISKASKQKKTIAKKYKIKREIFPYKIGASEIKIVVSKTSTVASKFVYFNMHDNENTAVEAALEVIENYGGTLVELQNDGERLIKFSSKDATNKQITFDPNRIFTVAGIRKTLALNSEYSIESETEIVKFAEKLKSYFKNAQLIIAVHNNSEENYSIKSYEQDGEFSAEVKLVNANSELDSDDFFYVTENDFFKFLQKKNQNVALQNNAKVTDDGSLAVYCGKNKISYVNVESEHGHLPQQIEMLEILQDLIKKRISVKKKSRGK